MGLSRRAYAAVCGVPMPAVREAIAAGRIKEELIAGSIQRENNGHLPSINASLVKRRYVKNPKDSLLPKADEHRPAAVPAEPLCRGTDVCPDFAQKCSTLFIPRARRQITTEGPSILGVVLKRRNNP